MCLGLHKKLKLMANTTSCRFNIQMAALKIFLHRMLALKLTAQHLYKQP